MKTLCSSLILLLLLHLQCGGSCLAESLGLPGRTAPASTEPPCHQHGQTPVNDQQPPHQADSICSQGPLIQSKLSIGKVVLHLDATLLLDEIDTMHPADFNVRRYVRLSPQLVLLSPAAFSVLRI